MDKKIYLDSASTTYVNIEVLQEMIPVFTDNFGNSNSVHELGREAKKVLDTAREHIAKVINASDEEIYFTSGGTEANNWALKGLARANKCKGNHIITSCIEHDSVLSACKELEKEGFKVTYLPVDKNGIVCLDQLMHTITNKTILVSVMTANNEVGTIQNLNAIAKTVKEKGIIFHTDACSAFGSISINVQEMGIDALTMSAHKIYGPKGIGALYIKNGVQIDNIISGGSQERAKRSGTVNVAGAVGFGKAAEICLRDYTAYNIKLKNLRDYFTSKVLQEIPNTHLNGHTQQRLNYLSNIAFDGIDSSALLTLLDLEGVYASNGPACTAGDIAPSHVLLAMNNTPTQAKSSIRFSFSRNNTKNDVDIALEILKRNVEKLRAFSPATKMRRG